MQADDDGSTLNESTLVDGAADARRDATRSGARVAIDGALRLLGVARNPRDAARADTATGS